jgi:predicted PurR-regulated permease PerM
MRFRSRRTQAGETDQIVELDPADFAGLFATPRWLRDLGVSSWLLVGVTLLLVGAVWLLSLTDTIVMPVITAAVVAAVASPLVRWFEGHGIPRIAGALLLLVAAMLLAVGFVVLIVAGITNELDSISGELSSAKDTIEGWLKDIGVDPSTAKDANDDASSAATSSVSTLLQGVAGGIKQLSSLFFYLALTILSLVFLLVDGPRIRSWIESHLPVPEAAAHSITRRVLESLRGYFLGVTIVAAFNAVVVSIAALILGVPLVATIAIVTFLGAYVPYLGAWGAGAFSVLLALGGAGTDAAAAMIVVQLLANGILQQMIQPLAYGAALGIHPLAVLIVTIGGGCLFGAVGLILAAPLTAAATKVATDLARARAEEDEPAGPQEPAAPPSPA